MISILKENEVVQFGDYQEYYEDSNVSLLLITGV